MNARFTWVLLAVALGLAGVDWVAHNPPVPESETLPAIEKFDHDAPTELIIVQGDTRMTFTLDDAGNWQLGDPWNFQADQSAIRGLLNSLRRGIPMDARVDRSSDNHDSYGLSGGKEVYVEINGAAGRINAFYLGSNAASGSTFLRFPDSDEVYRARLGGRSRFDRPPGEWRDHAILQLEEEDVVRIRVIPADGVPRSFVQVPGEGTATRWAFGEDAPFDLDAVQVVGIVEELTRLRASEILAGDAPLGTPVARVVVETKTGETHTLDVGLGDDEVGFLRLQGRDAVFRVASTLAERLGRPWSEWEDKTLLALDSKRIRKMTLVEPTLTSVLELGEDGETWTVTSPPNVDADSREAMVASRNLSRLRAMRFAEATVTSAEAGFPSKTRIEVELDDGTVHRVEIGGLDPTSREGFEQRYIRVAGRRIAIIPGRSLQRIRRAWAR